MTTVCEVNNTLKVSGANVTDQPDYNPLVDLPEQDSPIQRSVQLLAVDRLG